MSNSHEETNENIYRRVDELEVAVRTFASLQKADFVFVGELIQKTKEELLAMGFDKRSVNELRDLLSDLGLSFGTKLPSWPGREEAERLAKELLGA